MLILIGVIGILFQSRETAPWSKYFDSETYNCPDYDQMICKPMDLQILARKLSMRTYKVIDNVLGDVKLIVHNYYTKGGLRLAFLNSAISNTPYINSPRNSTIKRRDLVLAGGYHCHGRTALSTS
jgi:hypothetical protein